MAHQSTSRIEEILWPKGDRRDIWMILDCARERRVYSSLLSSYLDYSCLYAGDLAPELEVAAPHLVQLEYEDKYSRRILELGWGNSWGIFLKCDASLRPLRRHLRHFLMAQTPRGRLVFRYYDPRVLRVYLPTCLTDELRLLFGPIECFWTEGKVPEDVLEFRLHRRGTLERRTLSLDPARPSEPWPPGSGANLPFIGRMPQHYPTWTIRQAQLNVFSQVEVEKFEEWMVEHLNRFFPRECQNTGEARVRETIRHGINRAAAHGITARRDVCKYIDLAMVFGPDFDTDRRSGWAAGILRRSGRPEVKIRTLLAAAQRRLGNR